MIESWEEFKTFVKENKKEIAITLACGIGIGLGAGYAIASYRGNHQMAGYEPNPETWPDRPDNVVPMVPVPEAPTAINCNDGEGSNLIDVREHVRNLPESWSPSPAKIAEAESRGISLAEHQTIVDGYQRSA